MVLQSKITNKFACLVLMLFACFGTELDGSKSFSYPKSSSSRYDSFSRRVGYGHRYHRTIPRIPASDTSMDWRLIFALVILLGCFVSWNLYQKDIRHWYRKKYLNIQKGDQYHAYKDYNQVADWFDKHRSRQGYEKKYLDMVLAKIPVGGKILDLGCGMGQPVTQYLIEKGYQVTGVERSDKLITMARDRYQDTEFIYADMREINFNRKFDAIILWHSFFHLPVGDQKNMFSIFVKHLKAGGILLFTSGPQAGEIWSDNGGIDMYHASLSADGYKWQLEEYHFKLLEHVVEDPECGDATVWIAQYLPPLL